ncbi:MAG: polyprenyl synthetase family protein [Planctomycetota bacterium]
MNVQTSEQRERELHALIAPIADELEASSVELNNELDCNSEGVREIALHARRYRGKRLRAAVVLLTGKACGRLVPEHTKIAAIVEMIHMATLVHDDVLDRADLRRRVPTVNAKFGNNTAVLLGDWIYARAFAKSTKMNDQTCSRLLAEVTATVCRGEIEQSRAKYDFTLTEDRYIQMIDAKTASLYAASSELGARYACESELLVHNSREFGKNLGLAFQIVDDCLDLDGSEAVVGKSLGTDIAEGKITLPMIYMLQGAGDAASARVQSLFNAARELEHASGEPASNGNIHNSNIHKGPLQASAVLKLLVSEFQLSPAIERAYAEADRYIARALKHLQALPPSPARECLDSMAKYILERRW